MTQWFDRSVSPSAAGWYSTARLDLPSYSVPRYFDDTAAGGYNWFIARDNGGGDSIWNEQEEPPLVVNMSFDVWCELPRLK